MLRAERVEPPHSVDLFDLARFETTGHLLCNDPRFIFGVALDKPAAYDLVIEHYRRETLTSRADPVAISRGGWDVVSIGIGRTASVWCNG